MNRVYIKILLILSLTLLSNCERSKNGSGDVIFYTDAQAWVNCGPWNVHVFVDEEKVGILSEPALFDPSTTQPNCGDTLTITVNKPVGSYNYSAEGDCSTNLRWEGSFEIEKDNCTRVYIDIHDIIQD